MFEATKNFFMSKLKRSQSEVKAKPVAPAPKRGRYSKRVVAVTKNVEMDIPVVARKPAVLKKSCGTQEHDCLAIQLTNRIISMVLEFEINMKRIQNHPTLSEDTKSDIANYINKNIITALWALSPAFDLMVNYPRVKAFRSIYAKAFKSGVPGILQEIKHI